MIRVLPLLIACLVLPSYGARLFTAASSQYLAAATIPSSVEPMTMAGWIMAASTHVGSTYGLGTIAATDRAFINVGTTPNITGNYTTSGGAGPATYNVTYGTTWHHIAWVIETTTRRVLYYDGSPVATNTTSVSAGTYTMTYIGTRVSTTPGAYFDGTMAEVAFWSVALTADEISALAAGGNPAAAPSPRRIRPDKITYAPLLGVAYPEFFSGGTHLYPTNTPTAAAHPAIRR